MSSFFTKPKIPSLPPVPPAPPPSTELTEVRAGGRELYQENLERARKLQSEQEATRKAIEETLGIDLSDLLAQAGVSELGLFTGLRGLQAESLAGTEQERTAFQRATGLSPEDYAGEEAARQLEIGRGFQQRYRTALEGGLPTDPAMAQRHLQEQRDLDERFRRALGSGYQLSSPYSTAFQDMLQRQGQEKYLSGQYELERAARVGYTLSPAAERTLGLRRGLLAGVPNVSPYQFAGGLGSLGLDYIQTPPQFGQLTQEYNYDRSLQANVNQQRAAQNLAVMNAQIQAQNAQSQAQGGLMSGLLTLGGAALGGPLGAALGGALGGGLSAGLPSYAPSYGGSYYSGTPGYNTVYAPRA